MIKNIFAVSVPVFIFLASAHAGGKSPMSYEDPLSQDYEAKKAELDRMAARLKTLTARVDQLNSETKLADIQKDNPLKNSDFLERKSKAIEERESRYQAQQRELTSLRIQLRENNQGLEGIQQTSDLEDLDTPAKKLGLIEDSYLKYQRAIAIERDVDRDRQEILDRFFTRSETKNADALVNVGR